MEGFLGFVLMALAIAGGGAIGTYLFGSGEAGAIGAGLAFWIFLYAMPKEKK